MNILDSAQFGDATTKRFFMRVHASGLLPAEEMASLASSGEEALKTELEKSVKSLEEFNATFAKHIGTA